LQAGIVNNVSAVPLPPTAWLLALGLAGIAARTRRPPARPYDMAP
jgi:hypothetical protein